MNKKYALIVLLSFALSGADAEAAIVNLVCRDIRYDPWPEELWSFDYDSQVLTLTDFVYEIGIQPYIIHRERTVRVSGLMDSESTFTLVKNITNKTGVPLTGYEILLANTITTFNAIVEGSTQATGSPQIHQEGPLAVELAWLEPIPDGGSFLIQFDVFSSMIPSGGYSFGLNYTAIPEPATITLLGLGGLTLLRNRKSIKGKRKA